MKKLITLVAIAGSIGSSLFSMEPKSQPVIEEGLAYHTSLIPKDLKKIIVALCLQTELGQQYELFKQINTKSTGNPLALSPNCKTFLSQSSDGAVRLWSVETGRELQLFSGHTETVTTAAFSPDGKTILTGSVDGTARLWDGETGKELQLLSGHTNSVTTAAFSPNGETILTGSSDKTTRLWDVFTGQEVQQFKGQTYAISSLAFSPNGKTLLTSSYDGTAQLWNKRTGKKFKCFIGYALPSYSITCGPKEDTVFTKDYDTAAQLRKVHTKKEQLNGLNYPITSIAFSPDGNAILAGLYNNCARLWNVKTGKLLQQFNHTAPVNSVAFSPDGKTILTRSSNKTVCLWDVTTGKMIQCFPTDKTYLANFSSTGTVIGIISEDKVISLWKLNHTLTPEQKEPAYRIYLEKMLYALLTSAPQEKQ